MTLGIVRKEGFNRQNGTNQAFNHAGNMVGAALSGLLGWLYGFTAVVLLAALFGVLSILSVLMISAGAIDDAAARGMKEDDDGGARASGFAVLVECKPLLVLAAALACFHLGNGAMLPLYGLAVVLYVAAVARAGLMRRWPVRRWLENLAASLLPVGPFLIDARLRREQESIPRADVVAA